VTGPCRMARRAAVEGTGGRPEMVAVFDEERIVAGGEARSVGRGAYELDAGRLAGPVEDPYSG